MERYRGARRRKSFVALGFPSARFSFLGLDSHQEYERLAFGLKTPWERQAL